MFTRPCKLRSKLELHLWHGIVIDSQIKRMYGRLPHTSINPKRSFYVEK